MNRLQATLITAATWLGLLFSPSPAAAYDCGGLPQCCRSNCDDYCCFTQTGSTCLNADSCGADFCVDACAYCDPACLNANAPGANPQPTCNADADCGAGLSCEEYDCDGTSHCAEPKQGGTGNGITNCCIDDDSCADGFECCPPTQLDPHTYCREAGQCGTNVCGRPTLTTAEMAAVFAQIGMVPDPSVLRTNIKTALKTGIDWTFTAEVTDDDGLVIRDVSLGKRFMAAAMSTPYLSLRTSPKQVYLNNPPGRCELKLDGEACATDLSQSLGKGRSRMVDLRVVADDERYSLEATYEIDPGSYVPAPGQPAPSECFIARQIYEFDDQEPDSCNGDHGTTCYRYFPMVQVQYFTTGQPQRLFLRVPQRIEFAPDGHADGGAALFADRGISPTSVPNYLNPYGNMISVVTPSDGNPITKETRRFVVLKGKPAYTIGLPSLVPDWLGTFDIAPVTTAWFYGSTDNYHQTCKPERVDEPGVRITPLPFTPPITWVKPRGGCPDCAHVHWRWGSIATFFAKYLGGQYPGSEEAAAKLGWGHPLTYKDDNLSLVVATTVLKDGEDDPIDYRTIVDDDALVPGQTKTVFWYETLTSSPKVLTFAHGGFFVPNVEVCPPLQSCAPTGSGQGSDERSAALDPAPPPPDQGSPLAPLGLVIGALTVAVLRARNGGAS